MSKVKASMLLLKVFTIMDPIPSMSMPTVTSNVTTVVFLMILPAPLALTIMLLSTLVMMLTKDTGPSEIPGQQAGVNKDTSEWPEARTLVTLNTMPGFHTCKQIMI